MTQVRAPAKSGIRNLPWAKYAGKRRGEGGMKKEMSVAHVLAALGVLGLFISLFGLLTVRTDVKLNPQQRAENSPPWGWAIAITLSSTIAGLVWHHLSQREDSGCPDVLGKLLPHAHMMEVGGVQMAVFAFQHGPFCRVVVLAQNRFDQPNSLRLTFSGDVDCPVSAKIPGSGAVMLWRDHTLGEEGGSFKTVFGATASRDGNLVRHKRRNLLNRQGMQDFALVARGKFRTLSRDSLAARGNKPTQVIFADLVGKLPIRLVPMARVPPGEVADVTQDWVVKALWDPAKDGSDM